VPFGPLKGTQEREYSRVTCAERCCCVFFECAGCGSVFQRPVSILACLNNGKCRTHANRVRFRLHNLQSLNLPNYPTCAQRTQPRLSEQRS